MHRAWTRKEFAGDHRLGFLGGLLAVFVGAAPASAEKPEPLGGEVAALPVIAAVSITNNNIFDLDDPEEDKSIFRLANRFHVRTREDVIRQQLLFKPGEPLSKQAVEETERILRGNRYIQDVSVRAVPRDDGYVDVDIITSDVWTLMPKVAFKRAGGASETALGIKEMNLLGSGIAVEALYKSEIDRDSTVLKVVDKNLGRSWYRLEALMADNSDGHDVFLNIGKPFYSLNSRNSQDLLVNHSDRIESYYVGGELAAELQHEVRGSCRLAGQMASEMAGRNGSWPAWSTTNISTRRSMARSLRSFPGSRIANSSIRSSGWNTSRTVSRSPAISTRFTASRIAFSAPP